MPGIPHTMALTGRDAEDRALAVGPDVSVHTYGQLALSNTELLRLVRVIVQGRLVRQGGINSIHFQQFAVGLFSCPHKNDALPCHLIFDISITIDVWHAANLARRAVTFQHTRHKAEIRL